jgi:polyisoprenoid-binding protein YceI
VKKSHITKAIFALSIISSLAFAAPSKKTSKSPTVSGQPAASKTTPAAVAAPQIWEFILKPDDSVFAVITHKTGVAAKLAHNHFIAARQFNGTITANPEQLNSGKFTFQTKVSELEFDRSDLQKKWFPFIRELGWHTEPFSELKDSDRETIREHALADDQMAVNKYPEISAQLETLSDSPSRVGSKSFTKKASVSLKIHGQTVKRDFAANINLQGQELIVEAVGEFKFTEFGIKPYKALMGALGNEDRFNMLVSFRAVKK